MDFKAAYVPLSTKQALIRDALRAADCRVPDNAAFVQIFFDYLVLYFHGAICATLSLNEDSVPAIRSLHSLDNPHVIKRPDASVSRDSLKLELARLKKSPATVCENHDGTFLHFLLRQHYDRLRAGIKDYPQLRQHVEMGEESAPEILTADTDLLEPVRQQLDAIYSQLDNCDLFKSPPQIVPRPDHFLPLFAVARHPASRARKVKKTKTQLTYTPHLLLGNFHLDALATKRHSTCADIRTAIEQPLQSGRAAADSPLMSGTADFIPAGGSRTHGSPNKEIEADLFSMCQGGPLMFVPVHIGAIPWMAFFTVEPTGNGKSEMGGEWLRHYHFYRDVCPYLAGAVANGVHDAFANALVKEADKYGGSSAHDPEHISDVWRPLTDQFRLYKSVKLKGNGNVEVTSLDGPGWRVSNPKVLAKKIEEQLQRRRAVNLSAENAVVCDGKLHVDGFEPISMEQWLSEQQYAAVKEAVEKSLAPSDGSLNFESAPLYALNTLNEKRLAVLLLLTRCKIKGKDFSSVCSSRKGRRDSGMILKRLIGDPAPKSEHGMTTYRLAVASGVEGMQSEGGQANWSGIPFPFRVFISKYAAGQKPAKTATVPAATTSGPE